MNGYISVKRMTRSRKVPKNLALVVGATMMLSGAAFAQTALGGSDLILPVTASPSADMVLLKTESASRFGSFSIAVTNTGPVAVTGALVTDKPGLGGNCSNSNPVVITGNGVPEGSFTLTNLSGLGIALAALQPGQTATLTYSCQAK